MDAGGAVRRAGRITFRTPLSAHGEPMVWLTAGTLILALAMVFGLLLFIVFVGGATFWPAPVVRVRLLDGRVRMGEVTRDETFAPGPELVESSPPEVAEALRSAMEEDESRDDVLHRRLFRVGNVELTGHHFEWISDYEVVERDVPKWALVLERSEWGRFYGFPRRFIIDGKTVTETPEDIWSQYQKYHGRIRARWAERRRLERGELGALHRRREEARLELRAAAIERDLSTAWTTAYGELMNARAAAAASAAEGGGVEQVEAAQRRLDRIESIAGTPSADAIAEYERALSDYEATLRATEAATAEVVGRIHELNQENARFRLVLATADGAEKILPLDEIVRAYPANQLSFGGKLGVYASRWWEFVSDEPREANSEGGVFPAIIGTVLMTLIMAALVVPFGVLAALYLREYARAGAVISAVRIAINNLAGVPSIVFGVFGLGFFCYGVGGFIDGGRSWELPERSWFIALGVLALLSTLAFGAAVYSVARPGRVRSMRSRIVRSVATILWIASAGLALALIATTPFFDGFFEARLPNPTFGKGALVWASFTLALLTLPVVIVATEEALAAVPNSMREGSYGCGAGKWQTIKRIVLPQAAPGIMTGAILAMARGAGEVAPLMLVGAVKLAPELPISADPGEYFGLNRSFMHLGFHVYDLGFQSQNSEAAKPLVFTTTLLLVLIIATLNLIAVYLRSRLRRRFVGSQF